MAIKLSLVTPTFNRAELLPATLQSVAQQNRPLDLQYIVMDGGSTDGTQDILRAHSDIVSDWVSEPDGGMYDAIAKGFDRCDGDVFGWINSDDILFPWALNLVSRIFEEIPTAQWISTLTQTAVDAAGDILYFRKVPGYSQQAFFDGVYFGFGGAGDPHATEFIQQESTFFRRSLWEKVGPGALKSQSLAGDFALWTAFMGEAAPIGVDAPLGAFRVHSAGQLSRGKREIYVRECKDSLLTARARLQYTSKPEDGAATYTGLYAEKQKPEDESSSWIAVERPFHVLPHGDIKSAINQRRVF
jgi:cellulose synthase/poly-beta-1,6-N-acetylglucosamine synthase-like glycosyltransferase